MKLKMNSALPNSFFKAFPLATRGIIEAIKKERNLKFHLLVAFLAIILALILKITQTEWLILILTIFIVLAAETFNSAIEEISNLLKNKLNLKYEETKLIRDIAAGAVLLLAIASVIIGLIIFLPYLL